VKAFRDEAAARIAAAAGLDPRVVERALEVPDLERGDFAFPCFPLAKERRAPPPKIAAEIASKVATGGRIAKAVAVGPYVNLFVDRAQFALDLAASGRDVVVVSSGDPGVFAMATVVIEALHTDVGTGRWAGVEPKHKRPRLERRDRLGTQGKAEHQEPRDPTGHRLPQLPTGSKAGFYGAIWSKVGDRLSALRGWSLRLRARDRSQMVETARVSRFTRARPEGRGQKT